LILSFTDANEMNAATVHKREHRYHEKSLTL